MWCAAVHDGRAHFAVNWSSHCNNTSFQRTPSDQWVKHVVVCTQTGLYKYLESQCSSHMFDSIHIHKTGQAVRRNHSMELHAVISGLIPQQVQVLGRGTTLSWKTTRQDWIRGTIILTNHQMCISILVHSKRELHSLAKPILHNKESYLSEIQIVLCGLLAIKENCEYALEVRTRYHTAITRGRFCTCMEHEHPGMQCWRNSCMWWWRDLPPSHDSSGQHKRPCIHHWLGNAAAFWTNGRLLSRAECKWVWYVCLVNVHHMLVWFSKQDETLILHPPISCNMKSLLVVSRVPCINHAASVTLLDWSSETRHTEMLSRFQN